MSEHTERFVRSTMFALVVHDAAQPLSELMAGLDSAPTVRRNLRIEYMDSGVKIHTDPKHPMSARLCEFMTEVFLRHGWGFNTDPFSDAGVNRVWYKMNHPVTLTRTEQTLRY